MLILSRYENESIRIGDMRITVMQVDERGEVRFGVDERLDVRGIESPVPDREPAGRARAWVDGRYVTGRG